MSAGAAPAAERSIEERISAAIGAPESPPPAEEEQPEGEEPEPETEPEAEALADELPSGEGEEEAAEEADAAESDLSSLTYPVTIDGEVKEIPLADLAKGYLQERDYTQKTQALADERRAFAGERTAWAGERQKVAQQLDLLVPVLIDRMQSGRVPAERLAQLEREDPGEYARVVIKQQQEENVLRQAAAQRMALIQHEEAEHARELQASLPAARAKLMATLPAFKEADREKSADGFNYSTYDAVRAYVRSKGFSEEEAALTDPRMVEIAYHAMTAEHAARTVKKAQPKLGSLPRPIRPGARKIAPSTRETEAKETRALIARVKQSGKRSDAASAIGRLLPQGL